MISIRELFSLPMDEKDISPFQNALSVKSVSACGPKLLNLLALNIPVNEHEKSIPLLSFCYFIDGWYLGKQLR